MESNSTSTDYTSASDEGATPAQTPAWLSPRSLVRPREGRMLAGVAVAIADYMAIDVTVVRVVLAALCLMGGAGVPVYVAGWLLIPEEGAESSIAGDLLHGHGAY